jgi:hypothetical protein
MPCKATTAGDNRPSLLQFQFFGHTGWAMNDTNERPTLYCSFCGKSQREVEKLIAGPNVFICNECIELCMDILQEERQQKTPQPHERHTD